MSLGQNIKKLRERKGLTQPQLAELIGVSKGAISQYENDDTTPKKDRLNSLADTLGVSVSDLFSETENLLRNIGNKFSETSSISEPVIPYVSDDNFDFVSLPFAPIPLRASIAEMSDPQDHYGAFSKITVRVRKGEDTKDNIVFEVNGESMEPQLTHGTYVRCQWVDPSNWEYLSSGVYAVSFASSFVIKRVKDNEINSKGYLVLHSDNLITGGSTRVPVHQIHHIWKVLRVIDSRVV